MFEWVFVGCVVCGWWCGIVVDVEVFGFWGVVEVFVGVVLVCYYEGIGLLGWVV